MIRHGWASTWILFIVSVFRDVGLTGLLMCLAHPDIAAQHRIHRLDLLYSQLPNHGLGVDVCGMP